MSGTDVPLYRHEVACAVHEVSHGPGWVKASARRSVPLSPQQPVEFQLDRERCGGGEGACDTATVDEAKRAAEVAIKQRDRLIEVHYPLVLDTGVGVFLSLDDVVEALRTW